MDSKTATIIANEAFYSIMKARAEFPETYEYVISEMDICDDEAESAFRALFPDECL